MDPRAAGCGTLSLQSAPGPSRLITALLALAMFIGLLAVLLPAGVWLGSEAILLRRYPLTSTSAHAGLTPKEIARGAHLLVVAGCADCHGTDLEGHLLAERTHLPVYSGNLLRAAQTMTDEELERAIRYSIRPDATTEWLMPSASYKYMSDDDVASIVSWLHSRKPEGAAEPPPHFNFAARLALLRGELKPGFLKTFDSPSSLDLGPRYDGGRYLARITCAECHGTDLDGEGYAPDLRTIVHYDHRAFFDLLRRGVGAKGRVLPTMHRLAKVRFHAFADYEIMALYDYLDARAHAPADLVAKDDAIRRHEESTRSLNESPQ